MYLYLNHSLYIYINIDTYIQIHLNNEGSWGILYNQLDTVTKWRQIIGTVMMNYSCCLKTRAPCCTSQYLVL